MTGPLMALAVGAMIVGFIGIPPALRGVNAIDAIPRAEFSVGERVRLQAAVPGRRSSPPPAPRRLHVSRGASSA